MRELLDLIASVVSGTKPEAVSADFAALTADVKDKRKLLRTFIEASRKDIAQLREAGNDRERLREVVHRMLPMWELLQTDDLLHAYRNVLHDDKGFGHSDGEVHHPQKKGAGNGEKGTYGCLDNLRWLHNCRFFVF